jgi:hypothetical protein
VANKEKEFAQHREAQREASPAGFGSAADFGSPSGFGFEEVVGGWPREGGELESPVPGGSPDSLAWAQEAAWNVSSMMWPPAASMHVQQLQQEPGVMDAHLRVVGWKAAMGRSLKDVRVTISKQVGCELSAMRKEAPPKDAQASRAVRSVYFLRFDSLAEWSDEIIAGLGRIGLKAERARKCFLGGGDSWSSKLEVDDLEKKEVDSLYIDGLAREYWEEGSLRAMVDMVWYQHQIKLVHTAKAKQEGKGPFAFIKFESLEQAQETQRSFRQLWYV